MKYSSKLKVVWILFVIVSFILVYYSTQIGVFRADLVLSKVHSMDTSRYERLVDGNIFSIRMISLMLFTLGLVGTYKISENKDDTHCDN